VVSLVSSREVFLAVGLAMAAPSQGIPHYRLGAGRGLSKDLNARGRSQPTARRRSMPGWHLPVQVPLNLLDLVAGMVNRIAQLVPADVEDAAPVGDIHLSCEVDARRRRGRGIAVHVEASRMG
jgi:hypothetical protein